MTPTKQWPVGYLLHSLTNYYDIFGTLT